MTKDDDIEITPKISVFWCSDLHKVLEYLVCALVGSILYMRLFLHKCTLGISASSSDEFVTLIGIYPTK